MKDSGIIGGIAALLIVVGGILFIVSGENTSKTENKNLSTRESVLAQCLNDRGVIFYGAFWCPHCKTQKALFGGAEKLLPYVECSTADGNGQNQICIDKKITSYPTWIFSDGTQLTGEIPLDVLGEKSGCSIPAPTATTTNSNTELNISAELNESVLGNTTTPL